MDWISAHARKPVKHSMYFVRAGGYKKLVYWHEFDRLCELYDEVLWLEEACDKFVVAKPIHKPVVKFRPIDVMEPVQSPTTEFAIGLQEVKKGYYSTVPPLKKKGVALISMEREIESKYKRFKTAFTAEELALPIIGREFGLHKQVELCNFNNPGCPLQRTDPVAFLKFQTRATIIKHIKSIDRVVDLMEFSLYKVRHLYPVLKGEPTIPEVLLPEMLWIYGRTGIQVINTKLYICYRSKLCQNKNKQNGTAPIIAAIEPSASGADL